MRGWGHGRRTAPGRAQHAVNIVFISRSAFRMVHGMVLDVYEHDS